MGGGSHTWLRKNVEEKYPDIWELSKEKPTNKRYYFMLRELEKLEDEQALSIAEEFRKKIKEEKKQTERIRRQQRLVHFQAQLGGPRHEYAQKQIDKLIKLLQ